MLDEINIDAFHIEPREHICVDCHTVHWTPAGATYCGRD